MSWIEFRPAGPESIRIKMQRLAAETIGYFLLEQIEGPNQFDAAHPSIRIAWQPKYEHLFRILVVPADTPFLLSLGTSEQVEMPSTDATTIWDSLRTYDEVAFHHDWKPTAR